MRSLDASQILKKSPQMTTPRCISRRFPHGLFPPGSSELAENTRSEQNDKGEFR